MSARTTLASAALLLTALPAYASTWKTFRSSSGFSVEYPRNWFRLTSEPDRLDLLSAKRGAEGVVIGKHEAEIFVIQEPESPARTLAQVIEYYAKGTTQLSRADIPKLQRGACDRLEETVSKEPAVPPEDVPSRVRVEDFVYTGAFCQVQSRNITVMLKNWDGDPRQKQYQRIALRMAESIRLVR